jgi:hypothetical protein
MQRLLREPLLHFLLLGALLFAIYAAVNRNALRSPETVVVNQARAEALAGQFQRIWQRAPTRDELQGLIDQWVREEIVYREGLTAGMDRDDEVVRRRVVQKMTFITEGMSADVPGEAEMETWLRTHPDSYRIPPRYTLQQVYFDPRQHSDGLGRSIKTAAAAHKRGETNVGDPTLLPASLTDAGTDEVARTFGEKFAAALAQLPDGRWSGPVVSGFGVHLVRIDARTPERVPALAEVRPAVERDLINARSRQANEDFYKALRKRYTVKLEAKLDRIGSGISTAGDAGAVAGMR